MAAEHLLVRAEHKGKLLRESASSEQAVLVPKALILFLLHIKTKMDDIAVFYFILFSFQTYFSCFFGTIIASCID